MDTATNRGFWPTGVHVCRNGLLAMDLPTTVTIN